jgi:hypothetical protein
MSPRLSGLIAPQGRWALSGFLAVALGATLASSGVTAAGASTAAHKAATPAPHPYVKLQPRGVAHAVRAGNLINNGGPVQNAPRVFVVFWHWTSDPSGEQPYLTSFLSSIGGTSWLSTVNQYGGGSAGNLLAGTWSDSASIPNHPSDSALQAEAARAAGHFGAGTSVNVQIVVATPTGHSSRGFGTQYCAYHGAVSSDPNITYTDLPYMTDAGASCGENSVSRTLDGVSIVEGHELAEAITDPLLNAWFDASGQEIGDKCAWINLQDINTSGGSFAVQPLWSNAASGCVG